MSETKKIKKIYFFIYFLSWRPLSILQEMFIAVFISMSRATIFKQKFLKNN